MRTIILTFLFLTALLPTTHVLANGNDGNRYSNILPREYRAEISASRSYLVTRDRRFRAHHRKHHDDVQKPVIIDVRTVEEYVGGHPPGAYSIPFPHIYNRQRDPAKGEYIPADPDAFVEAVESLGLQKDAMIITMCRTGYRSVLAANLLARAGYTNVHNMWEGFVGRLKVNVVGDTVDLDSDGVISSDPYSGDLDGWANFAALPVSYKLKHRLLYKPYMYLYYSVEGER